MKILDTLTFVLIAGILNFVIADGESPPESAQTMPPYVHPLGDTNTTLDDISKLDKNLCEKNGRPNAYAALKQSREEYDACVDTLKNELIKESRNISPFQYLFGPPADLVKSYCRKVPQYENCMKSGTSSIKTCLDPEKRESVDFVYNTASRVMRFVCEDDAVRITELTSRNMTRCFNSKSSALNECLNQNFGKYSRATVSEDAAIGKLGIFDLLLPNLEKCNVFAKFQHCVIDELKACGNPSVGDTLNSVFDIAKETAKCDSFLASHAVTSPGSDLHPGN